VVEEEVIEVKEKDFSLVEEASAPPEKAAVIF
jgi:hypothetical protein